MKTKLLYLAAILLFANLTGCTGDFEVEAETFPEENGLPQTRAYYPYEFDWETIDFMPTHPSQARIESPWANSGSIVANYGIELASDRKKSEGWVLLFSTFDPTVIVNNPWFVLYNKYRGIMRIFYYPTDDFIHTSTQVYATLSVDGPEEMKQIIALTGKEYFDCDDLSLENFYTYILPGQVSSKIWYMAEFELSYLYKYTQTRPPFTMLSFDVGFIDITEYEFEGQSQGTIDGTIGTNSRTLIPALKQGGAVFGSGVLGAVGTKMTDNMLSKGDRTGFSWKLLKTMNAGFEAAKSYFKGNAFSAGLKILQGIFGGSSGAQQISMQLSTDFTITGTGKQVGKLPGLPVSFVLPYCEIPDGFTGQLPLFDEPIGVKALSRGHRGITAHYTLEIVHYYYRGDWPHEGNVYSHSEYEYGINAEEADWVIEKRSIEGAKITSRMDTLLDFGEEDYRVYPTEDRMKIIITGRGNPFPLHNVYYRVTSEVQPLDGSKPSAIVYSYKAQLREISRIERNVIY